VRLHSCASMRHSPAVLVLLGSSVLFVFQFQPGLCVPTQEDDDQADEDDDAVEEDPAADFMEEDDDDMESDGIPGEDYSDDPPDEDNLVDGDGGSSSGNGGHEHRRRGVPDIHPHAWAEEWVPPPVTTTTTTDYAKGVIGPGEGTVDPRHDKPLGPIEEWPQEGNSYWEHGITKQHNEPDMFGAFKPGACQGRRRANPDRNCEKGAEPTYPPSHYEAYLSRIAEECGDRRRVSTRRRLCDIIDGSRFVQKEEAEKKKTSNQRRRNWQYVAKYHAQTPGARRRRCAEGDGVDCASDLEIDSFEHPEMNSSVSVHERQGRQRQMKRKGKKRQKKANFSKTPNSSVLTAQITSNPKGSKDMSDQVGHLLEQSFHIMKQLDVSLNSTGNDSSSADNSNPPTNDSSSSAGSEAQAALLRRHIN